MKPEPPNWNEAPIGDPLPTVFSGIRPIQWIGRYQFKKSDPTKSWVKDVLPVRIARSAFGPKLSGDGEGDRKSRIRETDVDVFLVAVLHHDPPVPALPRCALEPDVHHAATRRKVFRLSRPLAERVEDRPKLLAGLSEVVRHAVRVGAAPNHTIVFQRLEPPRQYRWRDERQGVRSR